MMTIEDKGEGVFGPIVTSIAVKYVKKLALDTAYAIFF